MANTETTSSDNSKITTPYLSKYELARVLGVRAVQISMNSPIRIPLKSNEIDPLKIAKKELKAGKSPIIIRRYLPNGEYEDFSVNDLIIS